MSIPDFFSFSVFVNGYGVLVLINILFSIIATIDPLDKGNKGYKGE